MKHFGDSYDILKQSLLRWLEPFGNWSVHPMFTETAPSAEHVDAFRRLLNNATIVSTDILEGDTDREAYLSCVHSCGNLFLDPTTGLSLKRQPTSKRANYLYADELIQMTEQRSGFLTMAFDQSLPRGDERPGLEEKLTYLFQRGVDAFAYCSHASFVIGGRDAELVRRAYSRLLVESRLPEVRFVSIHSESRAATA